MHETLYIDEAAALLEDGFTCAIFKDAQVFKSNRRGVAPLLEWLESGENFHSFTAVDKVVGKAAAFLYVLSGVKAVYAFVLSVEAERVLKKYCIDVIYREKVAAIRNRTNTGFCPMEQAVWNIEDAQEAHKEIVKTLEKIKNIFKE